ncbi:MAG: 2-oxo acid dehydrogenase subunit E2 [Negativicutes bacterium]
MTTNVPVPQQSLTITVEVNMAAAKELKAELAKITGGSYSFTEFIVRCAAQALTEFRVVNSSLIDGQVIEHDTVNIGVAIALPRGFSVPVIKDVQRKSLQAIRHDILTLAKKVHEGKLLPDETSGGTFSVANLGMFGVDQMTLNVHSPESAILGICRIVNRQVVIDDAVMIQPMMNLCLSFDPQLIDSTVAAKFMSRVRELLEQPLMLLA